MLSRTESTADEGRVATRSAPTDRPANVTKGKRGVTFPPLNFLSTVRSFRARYCRAGTELAPVSVS